MKDKDELKFSLSIEDVADLVAELGGEPSLNGDIFTAKTICHCGNSHRLYYYGNTHLFKCYTNCPEDSFDIFQLVMKAKRIDLHQSILFVSNYFGVNFDSKKNGWDIALEDFDYCESKLKAESLVQTSEIELKVFDEDVIKNYPFVRIAGWEKEGIKMDIIKSHNIRYDPIRNTILIPHYDANNNLIGIRSRTLTKEDEIYGKYRPAIINNIQYNHPLGFALYNLNNSQDNIRKFGKAIVGEGEKFSLGYASFFGAEADISVACCGSNLIGHQVKLLQKAGAKEVIIAFDRQFKTVGDEEYKQWTHKLEMINYKYGTEVQISFMFDINNLLSYKESPIDAGPEIFMRMFSERIIL